MRRRRPCSMTRCSGEACLASSATCCKCVDVPIQAFSAASSGMQCFQRSSCSSCSNECSIFATLIFSCCALQAEPQGGQAAAPSAKGGATSTGRRHAPATLHLLSLRDT